MLYRGVAQPGSAPALGAGGRWFKSSRPDQKFLSVGLERTMGELVEEALVDLLKKYESKAPPKKGK